MGTGVNDKGRSISTGIAIRGRKKDQTTDWLGTRFGEPRLRLARHSMQVLDAIGLLLGQDARREALLLMLIDRKILAPLRAR